MSTELGNYSIELIFSVSLVRIRPDGRIIFEGGIEVTQVLSSWQWTSSGW